LPHEDYGIGLRAIKYISKNPVTSSSRTSSRISRVGETLADREIVRIFRINDFFSYLSGLQAVTSSEFWAKESRSFKAGNSDFPALKPPETCLVSPRKPYDSN
jgi:hypothetical protein